MLQLPSLAGGRKRALVAVLVAAFAGPSSAAGAAIEKVYAGPITASSACNPEGAGAVADLRASKYVDYCFATRSASVAPAGDDLKQVVGDFPAGTIAMVDAGPQCSQADFAVKAGGAARCTAETQVGEVTASVRIDVGGIVIPQTIHGRILNVEHSAEEVGLLGVQLEPELAGIALPRQKFFVRFLLRSAPDVGLTSTMDELPRSADTGLGFSVPIALDAFSLRFWGSPADHPTMPAAFARNGSNCEPGASQLQTRSYAGVTGSARSASYRLIGCESQAPAHAVQLAASERRPDVPSGVAVMVSSLPQGDPARHAKGTAAACPPASAIGTVRFTSPTSDRAFTGSVYAGPATGTQRLPQLLIDADNGGTSGATPRIKLIGRLSTDDDGTLTTTLSELPDLPFATFELTLRGGDNAVLSTPRRCGTTQGESIASGRSPSAPGNVAAFALSIDQDCTPQGSTPTFGVELSSSLAGADGSPAFTVARADRTPRLTRLVVQLPPGLLASLRGVPECRAGAAESGGCYAASRIGTLRAQAGVGTAPAMLKDAPVYLTQPAPGSIAALSIVVPVTLGDLDMGPLVVAAQITLRPADLGLDLVAELPARFRGIAIDLRSAALRLDRPSFAQNPTSCAPLAVGAAVTSDDASTARLSAPMQATGCEALGFDPHVDAELWPQMKAGDSAGLAVRLTASPDHAALKQMKVTLPAGIAADLSRISRACPVEIFRAGQCGETANVGAVAAEVGILEEPLRGRVVVVKFPNETLPGVGIELGGRASARIEGHVAVVAGGRLAVTFDDLPDVPIIRLGMTLEEGASSVLKVSKVYCPSAKTTDFDVSMTGHNGRAVQQTASAWCGSGAEPTVRRQPAVLTAALKGRATRRAALTLTAKAPGSAELQSLRVQLPSGASLSAAKVRKMRVAGARLRATSRRTLLVSITDTGRRTLKVVLHEGTLQLTQRARRSTQPLTVTLTARYTDGGSDRRQLKLR